jgi:glutamate/aspartate transport system substrate-binding protein
VNSRKLLAALVLALVPALAAAQAPSDRVKRIKDTKTILIAHRTDAAPFSFVDDKNQPVGYSVDLCKKVVSQLEQQLGVTGLQIKWVAVTTQNRFDAVAKGDADMECGSSSVSLARMKQVDFSNFTFVDGTGILARSDLNARSLGDLAGKKIAAVSGTTNETALSKGLKERLVNATVVAVKSREEGIAKLEAKEVDAFVSDNLLLLGMARKMKDAKAYAMVDDALSMEPYAIVLPRTDSALRIEVNTALARIYNSQAIGDIYGTWFGSLGRPGAVLRAVYGMGAIPE